MLSLLEMVNRLKKIYLYKWEYLVIFLIAFLSDDSYWVGTSGNVVLSLCRYVFIAAFPVVYVGFLRVKFDYRIASLILIVSLLLLDVSLFNGGFSGGSIMLLCSFVAAAVIVKKIPLMRFSKRFCELVIAMILISVAIQIMIALGVVQVRTGVNVAGEDMNVFGGFVYVGSYFGLLNRNACFFREPGVFMVYICVAYLLDIWTNKNGPSLRRQFLYFLGILSTMSTAGILIWGVLFVICALRQRKMSAQHIITIVAIGAVAFLVFQNEIVYKNFFSKLEKGTDSLSVLGRVSSITIPLKMTLDSPFFGCGTENFREAYMRCGQELYHTTIDPQALATNSILNASAVFGLWFGVFLIYGLLKFSKLLAGRNVIGYGLSFFAILLLFSNETMQYSLILYVLLFYGLMTPGLRLHRVVRPQVVRQCAP